MDKLKENYTLFRYLDGKRTLAAFEKGCEAFYLSQHFPEYEDDIVEYFAEKLNTAPSCLQFAVIAARFSKLIPGSHSSTVPLSMIRCINFFLLLRSIRTGKVFDVATKERFVTYFPGSGCPLLISPTDTSAVFQLLRSSKDELLDILTKTQAATKADPNAEYSHVMKAITILEILKDTKLEDLLLINDDTHILMKYYLLTKRKAPLSDFVVHSKKDPNATNVAAFLLLVFDQVDLDFFEYISETNLYDVATDGALRLSMYIRCANKALFSVGMIAEKKEDIRKKIAVTLRVQKRVDRFMKKDGEILTPEEEEEIEKEVEKEMAQVG